MGTVAFWTPDILPPDDWLMASLLYQEGIATIAPMASLIDADRSHSRRMEDTLGDLWERVHFAPKDLDLESFVRARLPGWVELAKPQAHSDPYTRQWLDRVYGWPHVQSARIHRALAVAEADFVEAQAGLAQLDEASLRDGETRARLAAAQKELDELRPVMRAERNARIEMVRELEAEARALRRRAWGVDPRADAELRRVHRMMRATIAALTQVPSLQRQRYLALCNDLEELCATDRRRREGRAAYARAQRAVRDAEGRVVRWKGALREPWIDDRPPLTSLWHGGMTLPDGLESIAWGKIQDEGAFRFLATGAGFWTVRHPREPWAHSLIGPTWIVEDLLTAVAGLLIAGRRNWALAGDIGQLTARTTGPRDPVVAIGFSLPCPASGTVVDAVRFRRTHAEELSALRDLIEAELDATDPSDLRDAIADLRHMIAEPVAEVGRALELDGRLGSRAIGITTLREIPLGIKGLASAAAASLLAEPIAGPSLTVSGLIGSAIGGAALVGASVGAGAIANARERKQLGHGVLAGPYRYLYDVGREFGLAD